MVRGLGPSLGAFGVAGALADPVLELRDSSGATLASNDNWRDAQEDQIKGTSIPPPDDLEAAIVTTLPAQQDQIEETGIPPNDDRASAVVATLPGGAYTAVVREKDGPPGLVWWRFYRVP